MPVSTFENRTQAHEVGGRVRAKSLAVVFLSPVSRARNDVVSKNSNCSFTDIVKAFKIGQDGRALFSDSVLFIERLFDAAFGLLSGVINIGASKD